MAQITTTEQYETARLNSLPRDQLYPHTCATTHTILQFIHVYNDIPTGTIMEFTTGDNPISCIVSIAGRIESIRTMGNITFITIRSDGNSLQIVINRKTYSGSVSYNDQIKLMNRGDIVYATGHPGRTSRNELSLFATSMRIVTPCLRMLPPTYTELQAETKYRKPYLALMLNPDMHKVFRTRTLIINTMRKLLNDMQFTEVETPILHTIPGGAAARPFITHHNDLDLRMYMRIAPELFLKQLVIGGMERVYEIGRQFRNEGIDMTHNPEFTMCEFYIAYCDYNILMNMTEQLLSEIVYTVTGSYVVNYTTSAGDVAIDFTPPYRRIDMIPALEQILSVKLPDFNSPDAPAILQKLCASHDINCSEPHTVPRLLDALVGHFLESQCTNPTFIINHPEIMSPLAKYHRSIPGMTERFELFVMKRELCNAYTELNDPIVQQQRFSQQADQQAAGDTEAHRIDHAFIDALYHGLPPTAGWGCGIDRLTMLLTNKSSIRDVLLFPTMKPNIA